MSAVGEMLDRLSGIAVLRQQLTSLKDDMRRTADLLVDHERRLVRLETLSEMSGGRPSLPPRGFADS